MVYKTGSRNEGTSDLHWLPGKGKETRTLGRDRRHPSGHDPPPGWVGGFFHQISWGMACCLRAVSCVIGGLTPPPWLLLSERKCPVTFFGRSTDDLLGQHPKLFNADCVGPKLPEKHIADKV